MLRHGPMPQTHWSLSQNIYPIAILAYRDLTRLSQR